MEVELEQLVAKRFGRKSSKKWNFMDFFPHQVTKDKMLAEKDEELRRMQEMLAQMQVTMKMPWTHGCPSFHTSLLFSHISSNPHLSPIQPSGTNFPSHISILG